MIKRSVIFSFVIVLLLVFAGCDSHQHGETLPPTHLDFEKDGIYMAEETDRYYVVCTDWMKFNFSKDNFEKNKIIDIAREAFHVMEDVRNFLGVNYNEDEAKGSVCFFDSTCKYNGQQRSHCDWNAREMYCVLVDDFIHEYVHMVCGNNKDLVYPPDALFSEGIAQYIALNFNNGIASENYSHFKERTVLKSSDTEEDKEICGLLKNNGYDYNASNYNKAVVALAYKNYDLPNLRQNTEFYKYYMGFVVADYCIHQLGGIEKFMLMYCDSIMISEVYGKNMSDIIIDACEYNVSRFYK